MAQICSALYRQPSYKHNAMQQLKYHAVRMLFFYLKVSYSTNEQYFSQQFMTAV